MRVENRSTLGVSGSVGRGVSRQLRGAERDGRLGADLELGRVLAVTDLWSSPARSGRPSGRDGERYAWTRIFVSEIRDGRLHRCASSSSTTRTRRSLTPRSGCVAAKIASV